MRLAFTALAGAVAVSAQPFQAPPPLPPTSSPVSPVSPESIPLVKPQTVPPATAVPGQAPLRLPGQPMPLPQVRPPVQYTPHLAWETDVKTYAAKAGEPTAHFTFGLTNVSSVDVVVNRVTTSCGCTVARLPSQPWRLTPGAGGQIEVTVDLRGKWGTLQKFITVDTSDGFKPLRVQVTIPTGTIPTPALMANRARNLEMARADRQAVFKNDCAQCHLQPAVGKTGSALYQAACAICHESTHRATMVPDLRALTHATDRQFWKSWIASGKPGTLMPAFAAAEGGPLTDVQVDSLADYLAATFPQRAAFQPPQAPAPPAPPLPIIPTAPPPSSVPAPSSAPAGGAH